MTGLPLSLRIAQAAQVALLLLFASSERVSPGQQGAPQARKLDQFEEMSADSEQARLDNFAEQLGKNADHRGFIIGYRYSELLPGAFLRRIHGFREYVVNRGVEASRLVVVEGGTKEKTFTELWLVPPGADPPNPTSTKQLDLDSPVRFDELSTTDRGECVGEFTLELSELRDALRFFGQALGDYPESEAWIVVHPSTRKSSVKASQTLNTSTDSLVRDYGVERGRVLTAVGGRRSSLCTFVHLWIVAANSARPDEAAYYSQLMDEAERDHYAVSRVEFLGNQHIRDNILRRRFVQQEGDLFTRKALDESLRNFSRLKMIYAVTINEVEVQLNRGEKTINLAVFFRERSRVGRTSKHR